MAATSQDFRKWDEEEADSFDTARAGGNPTIHVMRRSCQMEIEAWKGHAYAATLWDISTFFKAVEPGTIALAAADEGLPPGPAALAV